MRASNVGSFCIALALALPLFDATRVSADDARSRASANKPDSLELGPLFRVPPAQSLEVKADIADLSCDVKCLVEGLVNPVDLRLSIPKQDGAAEITFSLRPTSITRGKGIVATGSF